MTENEPVRANRQPSLFWVSVIFLITAMATGGVEGHFDGLRDAGETVQASGSIHSLVLLIGLGTLAIYLSRFGAFWKSWSKRKRLYAASLILAGGIGLVSGMAIQLDRPGAPDQSLFGNGAINPGIAITLSSVWAGGMALSILLYHRGVDDHEKQAYLWGGLAGFYAIVFPAPAWWLLARADLAPPVDGMILFLLALIANAIVYFWLKFR
jgi:hypothetical protein